MGAYGSPEFLPRLSDNDIEVSKLTKKLHSKNTAISFLLGLILILLLALILTVNNKLNIPKKSNALLSSSSVSMSSVPVSSAPVVADDSNSYLREWSKQTVLKALTYPNTATFSEKDSDWKIVKEKNVCKISSIVTARGKTSKQKSSLQFEVRISYTNLKAIISYVSINGKVSYDASKSKYFKKQ